MNKLLKTHTYILIWSVYDLRVKRYDNFFFPEPFHKRFSDILLSGKNDDDWYIFQRNWPRQSELMIFWKFEKMIFDWWFRHLWSLRTQNEVKNRDIQSKSYRLLILVFFSVNFDKISYKLDEDTVILFRRMCALSFDDWFFSKNFNGLFKVHHLALSFWFSKLFPTAVKSPYAALNIKTLIITYNIWY